MRRTRENKRRENTIRKVKAKKGVKERIGRNYERTSSKNKKKKDEREYNGKERRQKYIKEK